MGIFHGYVSHNQMVIDSELDRDLNLYKSIIT